MNKAVLIILAVVIVIAGGITLYARQNQTEKMENTEGIMKNENSMQKEPGAITTDSTMENKESITKDQGAMKKEEKSIMEAKQGVYKDYSPAALAEAAKDGKVVLFFWAGWCPFCKTANEAFISRASDIPSGVTVLKTNYDTEKELKTKYGVTYQHTFVQIDANGNQVSKWNGGDIDALKTNIK